MQRAAATSQSHSAGSHPGEHLLQGGHAILKDDPEPMAQDTRNASESASQQHQQQPRGYGGASAADLEQAGESVRKRDTQSL
ncbi:hypothetical protein CCMA1212_007389 [Trichoderma ghanense]|uniref:Uncharacterized protein n=1 Tax=Trichoderma ghanense TaxID=65468 RepID=A0ABY2GYN5_9HYPO